MGACAADYDNDGRTDLFVTNAFSRKCALPQQWRRDVHRCDWKGGNRRRLQHIGVQVAPGRTMTTMAMLTCSLQAMLIST